MHVHVSPKLEESTLQIRTHTHYVYQGRFLIQRIVYPESTRILIEAASAVLTVSFTACMRFCALPTSISVASWSSSEPENEADSGGQMSEKQAPNTIEPAED